MTKRRQRYPQQVPETQMGETVKIKHQIKPKNYSQELYLESLREQLLTICSGPAGSGKTYLVTAVAVEKLLKNEIDRIVITRPVVEAGEHLGFLPGTLEEKLDPYLLPLVDALEDHIGPVMTKKLLETGKIEIAPLAFMRGRTFNRCVPPDHIVLMSDGTELTMGEILDKFLGGEQLYVQSLNTDTNQIENKKIEYAFKQENNSGQLIKLTLADGTEFLATPDHEVYTQRGKLPLNQVTLDDDIIMYDEFHNS